MGSSQPVTNQSHGSSLQIYYVGFMHVSPFEKRTLLHGERDPSRFTGDLAVVSQATEYARV